MITVKRQLRPGVLCNPSLSVSFLTINFIQGPSRQLARNCRNQIQFWFVFLFPIQNWPRLCRTLHLLLYIDYLGETLNVFSDNSQQITNFPFYNYFLPSPIQQLITDSIPRSGDRVLKVRRCLGGKVRWCFTSNFLRKKRFVIRSLPYLNTQDGTKNIG